MKDIEAIARDVIAKHDVPATRESVEALMNAVTRACRPLAEALLREREVSAGLRAALEAVGGALHNIDDYGMHATRKHLCETARSGLRAIDEALRGAVAGDKKEPKP